MSDDWPADAWNEQDYYVDNRFDCEPIRHEVTGEIVGVKVIRVSTSWSPTRDEPDITKASMLSLLKDQVPDVMAGMVRALTEDL